MLISKHAVWRYRYRLFDTGTVGDTRVKIMDLFYRSRPAELVGVDHVRRQRDIVKCATYRVCDGVVLAIRDCRIIATVWKQDNMRVRVCR